MSVSQFIPAFLRPQNANYFAAEQKKMALVERFQNMKSKDRDRAIERRRKKATAKERRNMPDERRGV